MTLVLQTLLPTLLFTNTDSSTPSTVIIKGDTHNPLAPTYNFLKQAFLPPPAKLGMQIEIDYQQAYRDPSLASWAILPIAISFKTIDGNMMLVRVIAY